jgi:hypothetical protein
MQNLVLVELYLCANKDVQNSFFKCSFEFDKILTFKGGISRNSV